MDENCGIMDYRLVVQQDENGELFFEFPDELMNETGWQVGDQLIWEEQPNGSWIIKKDESKDE